MINNNELFNKILTENPPSYRIGDKVNTSQGIGYISGCVYKEREKDWKYTVRLFGVNNCYTDVHSVYGKVL